MQDDIKLPPLPPFHIVPRVEPVDYPEVAQVLMDYARAAVLADRERRQQWQPIETAPQGSMLLLADMTAQEARHWAYVDWLVAGKCCGNRHHTPTHWQPLPTPPVDAQRAKEDA